MILDINPTLNYIKLDFKSIGNDMIAEFDTTTNYMIRYFNTILSYIIRDFETTSNCCDFEALCVVAFRKIIFTFVRKRVLLICYQQIIYYDTPKYVISDLSM